MCIGDITKLRTSNFVTYNSSILIKNTSTIQFYAKNLYGYKSPVYTIKYIIDTVAPTASVNPLGGSYNVTKVLTLSMNEAGTIYYTLNGTNPNINSKRYSTRIIITSNTTLKYLAVDLAHNMSPIYLENYIIDKNAPKIVSTTPLNKTLNASLTSPIIIKFNEKIETNTIKSKTNSITVKNLRTGKNTEINLKISRNNLIINSKTTKMANT